MYKVNGKATMMPVNSTTTVHTVHRLIQMNLNESILSDAVMRDSGHGRSAVAVMFCAGYKIYVRGYRMYVPT